MFLKVSETLTSKMCLSCNVCRGRQMYMQNSKCLSSNACTFGCDLKPWPKEQASIGKHKQKNSGQAHVRVMAKLTNTVLDKQNFKCLPNDASLAGALCIKTSRRHLLDKSRLKTRIRQIIRNPIKPLNDEIYIDCLPVEKKSILEVLCVVLFDAYSTMLRTA